jgi:hypothetical protein
LQAGGNYAVQIIQVIARSGANFFDRTNPTGAPTFIARAPVIVTPPTPPAPPPPGPPAGGGTCAADAEIGPTVFLNIGGEVDQLPFPFNNAITFTPVGANQVQLAINAASNSFPLGPGLGSTTPLTFTPSAVSDTITFRINATMEIAVLQIGRSGANVCVKKISYTCNSCG